MILYAVVDVEAIVVPGIINIVEQIAYVLCDQNGMEVLAEKYFVYQPKSESDIAAEYGIPLEVVRKSADAYRSITGDEPIHSDKSKYTEWAVVKRHILEILKERAYLIYAKGINLENSVFNGELPLRDLAWWGVPKYPYQVHDPLDECRFFSKYIPEIKKSIVVL